MEKAASDYFSEAAFSILQCATLLPRDIAGVILRRA
jgi:hypothetical protein